MTNIYVCTHKDFNVEPFKSLKGNYVIVSDGTELQNTYPYPIIQANNELLPLKHSYSEGYMLYDIWKNDTESDYIGINHYRRYFDIQTKEDNINENVLPIPYAFDMYEQYGACHNIADLNECREIIEKYYPEYNTSVQGLFMANMAILEHSVYNEWCSFIFGVLDIFNERNHLHNDIGVRMHCMNNIKEYRNGFDLEYQSRLHGFLLERLSTIFFTNKFNGKPVRFSQIIIN